MQMNFRLAVMDDLLQLKAVFEKITLKLNRENGPIWDEVYPCGFFADDIENRRLYVLELEQDGELLSAFALSGASTGASHIKWRNEQAKALYFERFGVNVEHQGKGIGSVMLRRAMDIARSEGAEYLRLFVVDKNVPAMNFYTKNGFQKAAGIYEERFDDGFVLREFGYEIPVARPQNGQSEVIP